MRARWVSLLAIGAVFLSACMARIIEQPLQDPIVVTDTDEGAIIRLGQHQNLVVRLKGNPSTGFRWSLVDAGKPLLKGDVDQESKEFEPDERTSGMLGASGYEVWRFSPTGRGETTLRFEYRRPWEHGIEPIKAVMYTLQVTP